MEHYQLDLTIAPFPVKKYAFGRVQVRLSDFNCYLHQWSNHEITSVDPADALHWLKRIGVSFDPDRASCTCSEPEEQEENYLLSWKVVPIPYQPHSYMPMKQGIVSAILAIAITCPFCGGMCGNDTNGALMICDSDSLVRCEECKESCMIPEDAFQVRSGSALTVRYKEGYGEIPTH